jgi:hypothetical protein
MADNGPSRLWWLVGAIALLGLALLNVTAPERVFGIPASQFTMLYMATFCFALTFLLFFDDERVRALGMSIVAIGFLTRAGEPTIGSQISLAAGLTCIVIGIAVMMLGSVLMDSRATPSA